jgi:hypothetical protein
MVHRALRWPTGGSTGSSAGLTGSFVYQTLNLAISLIRVDQYNQNTVWLPLTGYVMWVWARKIQSWIGQAGHCVKLKCFCDVTFGFRLWFSLFCRFPDWLNAVTCLFDSLVAVVGSSRCTLCCRQEYLWWVPRTKMWSILEISEFRCKNLGWRSSCFSLVCPKG